MELCFVRLRNIYVTKHDSVQFKGNPMACLNFSSNFSRRNSHIIGTYGRSDSKNGRKIAYEVG